MLLLIRLDNVSEQTLVTLLRSDSITVATCKDKYHNKNIKT